MTYQQENAIASLNADAANFKSSVMRNVIDREARGFALSMLEQALGAAVAGTLIRAKPGVVK